MLQFINYTWRIFIYLSFYTLIHVLCKLNYDVELLNAAENGEYNRIDSIVNNGAYLDVRNNYGVTPLIWSANNGHIKTLKAIINRNPDIEATANNGKTSLLWASTWGHVDIMEYLIEKGANIEAQDKIGLTSLMCAVQYNHINAVELLLKYNVNTLVINNQGGSAASIARVKGHLDIYDMLILVQNKQIINKYMLYIDSCKNYILNSSIYISDFQQLTIDWTEFLFQFVNSVINDMLIKIEYIFHTNETETDIGIETATIHVENNNIVKDL